MTQNRELDSLRVLIIDDCAEDAFIFRRLMTAHTDRTYEIFEATTGEEGVAIYRHEQPDAVLLDYRLPDQSGIEVLQALRRISPDGALPVIMLTGEGDATVAVEAMKFGAQDFLSKSSVTPDALRFAVAHVAENCRLQRDVARQASELDAARREAEAAVQAKSAYLANVSHEIRTPLTAILGFAEELRQDLRSDNADDWVKLIVDNGEHLLEIVNDILDLSKIEDGKMRIEILDIDPTELVYGVIRLLEPRAIGKGIELVTEFENDLPEVVRTDPIRLRQVLINLISNAIKFTERGSVNVVCKYSAPTGKRVEGTLEFRVVDTGIGMSEENVDRLFRPFCQAEASTARKFGGTGLGLSISRHLARMLGGDISVTSTFGEGSEFVVRVSSGKLEGKAQVGKPDEWQRRHCVAGSDEGEVRLRDGLRVLVADDVATNRLLISKILGRAGAEVVGVDNGRQAVDAVVEAQDSAPFDLVLMDLQMPEVDGREAAEQLRAQSFDRPIVALTADASSTQAGGEAGFDGSAAKPIEREPLLRLIRQLTEPPS